MGLLVRQDVRIHRAYFSEMCKLIGVSVAYQYVVKSEMTIHSEDNSFLSVPLRIDVIFDDQPSVDTLKRLGWVTELNEQQPIVINMPYNTPNLTVNARIMIESIDGTPRPRVFKVTKIESDLEYPDAYTCAIVPVVDQTYQKNQYTLVNTEKISEEDSPRTSQEQPYQYVTGSHSIDTVPKEHTEWENKYNFINDKNSPYTG